MNIKNNESLFQDINLEWRPDWEQSIPVMHNALIKLLDDNPGFMKEDEFDRLISDTVDFTEACRLLKISKSWLYKLNASHAIPYFRIGGRVYYKKMDLDRYRYKRMYANYCKIMNKRFEYAKLKYNLYDRKK